MAMSGRHGVDRFWTEGGGGGEDGEQRASHDQSQTFLNLGTIFSKSRDLFTTSHVGSTLDIPVPVTSQSIGTDSKPAVKVHRHHRKSKRTQNQ